MIELGTLERVSLRTVWQREAADFTPWLAENLHFLGEAVGLEIDTEDVVTEVSVGRYQADLLCIDSSDSSRIVIENQFGDTNHDHLGKLLTYASALDSDPPVGSVIWISESFNDEHRSTLDWLNTISHDEIRFFGVKIELVKVDGSNPAPRFYVVSSPNDWKTKVRASSSGEVSDLETQYQQFWTHLIHHLADTATELKLPAPRAKQSLRFGIGRAGFAFRCRLSEQKKQLQVALEITANRPNECLTLLMIQQAEIEDEIGTTLKWEEATNGRRSVISQTRSGDPTDETERAAQIKWMAQTLDRFNSAFRDRVRGLTVEG